MFAVLVFTDVIQTGTAFVAIAAGTIVATGAIGYPPGDWTRPVRPRRELSEILWRDRWGREFPGADAPELRRKE